MPRVKKCINPTTGDVIDCAGTKQTTEIPVNVPSESSNEEITGTDEPPKLTITEVDGQLYVKYIDQPLRGPLRNFSHKKDFENNVGDNNNFTHFICHPTNGTCIDVGKFVSKGTLPNPNDPTWQPVESFIFERGDKAGYRDNVPLDYRIKQIDEVSGGRRKRRKTKKSKRTKRSNTYRRRR